ncbi:F0F1 ATP synthase subunit gamma [Hydrogenivirga sp.]
MSLERKLRTLRALKSTLNVWEVIAVNRYKRYSALVGAQLPYFLRLQEVLEHLYALYPGIRTDLLELREEKRIDVLVLTSDRGYIGDFVTRTLEVASDMVRQKGAERVSLFFAGKKGSSNPPLGAETVVFEDVLTKNIDWERVNDIRRTLVSRYRKRLSDACYVVFQRPEVEFGEPIEIEEREKREALSAESPFFYTKFEEVLKVKPMKAVEHGRYRPVITRFLPADIRKRYSKETVLNIEADEGSFINELLELYINFFMKEVFFEHFTSINFARYRTISRILENIDKRLSYYGRLINKLRQDRITREIQDIVFSYVATESKRYRDIHSSGYILELDVKVEEEEARELEAYLERLGYPVKSLYKRNLIGGFRLIGKDEAIDLSVLGRIHSLEGHVIGALRKRKPR